MDGAQIVGEKTLAMLVANTGFMVDRLGQDCSPLQFLRELTQNSIEAILATDEQTGTIVWDVDWDYHALTGVRKLCVIDTGCGMTGDEMKLYINQLSSSAHEQSHDGNFGVGAKIAAATRNHEGLMYLSWKDGVGSMIHLWRDPETGQYGLRELQRPNGSYGYFAHLEDTVKPRDEVRIDGHGTKVVLLGNALEQDTMRPAEATPSPSRWIGRNLNTRYFRFPAGITVKAREGWENPRSDKDRNVLRTLAGQEKYLETHKESSGAVDLTDAVARWWILQDETALTQNSGFVASSGHVAALHNDELYEMSTGRSGVARLQMFGVIFGYQRVVIYVEPKNGAHKAVTSNTARTHLIMNGEPLPWADWAAEFRASQPPKITELMERITAGSTAANHKQAIHERLKQIRDLFRFSRYRPTPTGDKLVADDHVAGGRAKKEDEPANGTNHGGSGGKGGRAGNVYALFLADDGQPGEEVSGDSEPEVQWVTVADNTRAPGFLEDRAAAYLVDSNLLQINGDFRGFTHMVDRWCAFYSHVPGARKDVTEACREWFEQGLIETVLGVQVLKDSREWPVEDIKKALSEEALTAVVMQRYHIDVAVKRALGAKLGTLKDKAS
jgi:hypothetical protein